MLLRFVLMWVFVFAVAAYDLDFAWRRQADILSWEANPAAHWLIGQLGMPAMVAIKLGGLVCACLLAFALRRTRPGWLLTAFSALVHLALLLFYAAASCGLL